LATALQAHLTVSADASLECHNGGASRARCRTVKKVRHSTFAFKRCQSFVTAATRHECSFSETRLEGETYWAQHNSSDNACKQIHASMVEEYPGVDDPGRVFVPHLSIAMFASVADEEGRRNHLASEFVRTPFCYRINAVHILRRTGNKPFQRVYDVAFRNRDSAERAPLPSSCPL
jgi:hypothetical protein